jgi:hypothetical protein
VLHHLSFAVRDLERAASFIWHSPAKPANRSIDFTPLPWNTADGITGRRDYAPNTAR